MKLCSKCGAQLDDDMLFCEECGAKVDLILEDESHQLNVQEKIQQPMQPNEVLQKWDMQEKIQHLSNQRKYLRNRMNRRKHGNWRKRGSHRRRYRHSSQRSHTIVMYM